MPGSWRLTALAAALMPLIAFVVFAWLHRGAVLREAEAAAVRTTAVLYEHATKVFETHELVLSLMDERVRGMSWDAIAASRDIHDFLVALDRRFEQIDSLWLNDGKGDGRNSSGFFPMPPVNIADRDYFKAVQAGEKTFISRPYAGRLTGTRAFNMARRRTTASGEFDGLMLASVYSLYFERFYERVAAGADRVVSLTRADGVQLVRYPPLPEPVTLGPQAALMRAVARDETEGALTVVAQADGVARIYAYKKLQGFPVFVAVGVGRDEALAQWRRDLLFYGPFAAAMALLLLASVWLLHRRLQAQADLRDALRTTNAELERRVAERSAALTQRTAELERILDLVPAAVWIAGPDAQVIEGSRYAARMLRLPPAANQSLTAPAPERPMHFRLRRAGVELAPTDAPLQRAARGEEVRDEELDIVFDGGAVVTEIVNAVPLRDADGRINGAVGVALDITERKKTESRLRLLTDELNHRVKNTLASVQAIAVQTARGSATPDEFNKTFSARLAALARAHDILTRQAWEGADLAEIARETLSPFGADERLRIDGPSLTLAPGPAVSLSMMLHELATNAAKYGALSVPQGRVSLAWSVADGRLDLLWQEAGGPPVSPPSRIGFGSRLIRQGLAAELGAEVALDFEPTGVRCRLRMPLAAARAPA